MSNELCILLTALIAMNGGYHEAYITEFIGFFSQCQVNFHFSSYKLFRILATSARFIKNIFVDDVAQPPPPTDCTALRTKPFFFFLVA